MTKKSISALTITSISLLIFGSVMIASAVSGIQAGDSEALKSELWDQFIISVVAILAYYVAPLFRVLNYGKSKLMFIYIVGLILIIIPLFYEGVNDVRAWIPLFGFSFQSSEVAKIFAIVIGAKLIGVDDENNFKRWMNYICGMVLYVFIIIFLQNDFGTGLILCAIVFCIMYIETYKEVKKIHNILSIILLAVIALTILIMIPEVNEFLRQNIKDYRIARITSADNPFNDRYYTGYHTIMSLTSIASGGLFGVGYGNSIYKYMNFPNASSDYIAAILIEEIGLLGFLGMCVLYFGIMLILLYNAFRFKEPKYKILFFATFVYFFMHFVLNVGGISGLLPLTGVPLLMVSSGGSSTVSAFIILGICNSEIKRFKNESNSGKVQKVES